MERYDPCKAPGLMETAQLKPISRPAEAESRCLHCGTPFAQRTGRGPSSARFCCSGCETVHSILKERGLSETYYGLRERSTRLRPPRPVKRAEESFSYLDEPAFLSEYAERLEGALEMKFYLEGVHCLACLWLIERLPEFAEGVISADLDLGRSIVSVRVDPGRGDFRRVAGELDLLGYRPHPLRVGEGAAERIRRSENRKLLIRTGVAAAAAGNIMILAVSLYAGAEGATAQFFRALSLILAAPAVFYSAFPFYQGAIAGLKRRVISIDLPVAIAVVVGFLAGVVNVVAGWGYGGAVPLEHAYPVYFDSVSVLIFLLLFSRYVLRRVQGRALEAADLQRFVLVPVASRIDPADGRTIEVRTESLRAGDMILVRAGEKIPADGRVLEGFGEIDAALLTGESLPRTAARGDEVFGGCRLVRGELRLRVGAAGRESRVGKLLSRAERERAARVPIVAAADRVARYFVGFVLIVSLGLVAVFAFTDPSEGFRRALALVIVACPCALGLATPLAMGLTLGRASSGGFLIKSADVIERLSRVRTILLDKTGTLTEGRFEVLTWKEEPGRVRPDWLDSAVLAMERHSRHPVGLAIASFLESHDVDPLPENELSGVTETSGRGIEARVGGSLVEVRALSEGEVACFEETPVTTVGVFVKGRAVAVVSLGDRIRGDSRPAIARLRDAGYGVGMITGDGRNPSMLVASEVGISPEAVTYSATPERKRELAASYERAMMVGDGANDSLAMAASHVAAAVHGSMEVSLRTADVCIDRPGVAPLGDLLMVARDTMGVIRRNFVFSIVYNVAGAAGALLGLITPLAAAILMPLSALTVFASTLVGTRRLRRMGG